MDKPQFRMDIPDVICEECDVGLSGAGEQLLTFCSSYLLLLYTELL